jgi:hypothetical protein
MKLHQLDNGMIVSVGFNPSTGHKAPDMLYWSDPVSANPWAIEVGNLAGDFRFEGIHHAEFIREISQNNVIIYGPGFCVQMSYVGHPLGFAFNVMRPENRA